MDRFHHDKARFLHLYNNEGQKNCPKKISFLTGLEGGGRNSKTLGFFFSLPVKKIQNLGSAVGSLGIQKSNDDK
jgi:hypothetical protein